MLYRLTGTIEAKSIDDARKAAKKLGKAADVSVEKVPAPKQLSRADRLAEAESLVQQATEIVDELKDELQSWYDNLPDNFRDGHKGSELEEAINQLDDLNNNLESIDFLSVDFPSMF